MGTNRAFCWSLVIALLLAFAAVATGPVSEHRSSSPQTQTAQKPGQTPAEAGGPVATRPDGRA